MNRTQLVRLLVTAASALLAVKAAGQHTLEVLALRYRTAAEVLPALRPLLEPGATLSGHGNQLILRTSPANLAELKSALEAIDRPLRRLQISVRFDDAAAAASRRLEASGVAASRGARIDVRGEDQRAVSVERVDQRIQVLEGSRAYIQTGQSSPRVVAPGTTVMEETGTGFEAIPRLSGDTVLLEIAPRRDALREQQRLSTVVSARLGEWFEVGATSTSAPGQVASRRIWLKIEALR